MITVKVSYTVKADFVEENRQNIERFLVDFRKVDSDFRYDVFTLEDGVTFMHLSAYTDENVQKQILNVPSFLDFQKARDESGLGKSHKVEVLTHVGSSRMML